MDQFSRRRSGRRGGPAESASGSGRAQFGIDPDQLVIDPAGLGPPVELGQRLAEIEQAVGRAIALRIVLIIGEQDARRGCRLAVVETGAVRADYASSWSSAPSESGRPPPRARPAPRHSGAAPRAGSRHYRPPPPWPEPKAPRPGAQDARAAARPVPLPASRRAARCARASARGWSTRSSRAVRSVLRRATSSSSCRVRCPFSSTWPVSPRSCDLQRVDPLRQARDRVAARSAARLGRALRR